MILADKIIEERKKNGWSQEELAEKLGVTRQSVSKWEGAQSVPDLQRILDMSRLFGVSTDYLLKDEAGSEGRLSVPDAEVAPPRRVIGMEEARAFLNLRRALAPRTALAVFFCILGAALLVLLGGAAEYGRIPLSPDAAGTLGIVLLLLLVAAAVALFISNAQKLGDYERLATEEFETAYGVDGMLREEKAMVRERYDRYPIYGTVLCILSAVPLLLSMIFGADEFVCVLMTALLLLLVGIAVILFILSSANRGAVDFLLQEGEYSPGRKARSRRTSVVASVYWTLVTGGYLAWSFLTNAWGRTWIVWPVAAVLYPVVILLADAFLKRKEP